MIIKENIEIGGKDFVKQYSDGGFYIECNGEKYSEAIDLADIPRTYTEIDEPISPTEEPDETAQKAAAYDFLTGRSDGND